MTTNPSPRKSPGDTSRSGIGFNKDRKEDDLNRAIAMSLQNQHGVGRESDHEEEFEDVPMEAPKWTQKSVDAQKPITAKGGSMIAHIVNNRASAAVPRRQEHDTPADSDSDEDMQTVLAKARMKKKPQPKPKFVPVVENKKNPFDGPLPFPKLDWGSSLFGKKKVPEAGPNKKSEVADENPAVLNDQEDDMAGGIATNLLASHADDPMAWLTRRQTMLMARFPRAQNEVIAMCQIVRTALEADLAVEDRWED